MLDSSLTLNATGHAMPQSPVATNGVVGSRSGQTLQGRKGVSNWMISAGGGSTLIGGGSGDTFMVTDPNDIVVATVGSGINTIVSWTTKFVLPANVQNLIVQDSSGGVGVGNALDDLLVAEGSANFTLVAGTGNDVMIGNASGDPSDTGGMTTFVIDKGDGRDVISNFANGVDIVRLDGFTALTSLASVQAAMTQVGSDVVLDLGAGETLTFRHETIGQFTAHDFELPAALSNMTLRFSDSFSSFVSSPTGTQGWMTQGGQYWRTLGGNNEAEYYSDSSVGVNPFSVADGVLTITASPGSNAAGLPYNSGIITTEKSLNFEYGLIEVSAKLAAGNGLWPAIWLLPSNLTWPPEIDVMEMLGQDPTSIYVGTHSGAGNTATTTAVYVGDTTKAFHTYAVDWEPTTITWYFDGNKIFQEATPSDMHQPMYLLVNLAVGGAGSWPGAPTSAAEFPATLQIASVQYFASANTTTVSGTQAVAAAAAPPAVTIVGVTPVAAVVPAVLPAPVVLPSTAAITAITTSPGTGTVAKGGTITLSVTFSAAVTVAGGTPTLTLNDGGVATYTGGSGTGTLVFTTTVLAGQNTADLALAAGTPVTLGSATITDSYGRVANLAAAAGLNPAGTLVVNGGPPVTDIVVSGWWQTYKVPVGVTNVTGTAGGATIVLGAANQTVTVTGTNNRLTTGAGNQMISFTGANNTVVTGAGSSTINMIGAYQNVTVTASAAGPTTINAVGFDEHVTSTGTGRVVVTGPNANSVISLGDGDDTVTLQGSGNTVTVGVGTTTINAGIGQGIVHAGGGSDTIVVLGYNNLLDAGAGMNFLHGGSGNDTFVLNGAGQGLDTITGFTLTNSDVLDLTRTLAGTGATKATLSHYITASASGGSTTLSVDPTGGHGTASSFAVLQGVNASLSQLMAHSLRF